MSSLPEANTSQYRQAANALDTWNRSAIDEELAGSRSHNRASLTVQLVCVAATAVAIWFRLWIAAPFPLLLIAALAAMTVWRGMAVTEQIDWYRRRQACFTPPEVSQ